MVLTRFCAELPSRFAWFAAGRWYELRLCWYRADKGLWALVLTIGLVVATFGFALQAVFAHQDDRRNLTCLARNVYFEARGEPAAGQYAVAEVTMNRYASGRYADTVCGVVYQKNWDPLRKRYVGAFSWTELGELPAPGGAEWLRAVTIAQAVYTGSEDPVLDDRTMF